MSSGSKSPTRLNRFSSDASGRLLGLGHGKLQVAAMPLPKVVIIGGGVAGATAAQSLHDLQMADVTVVDRREYFDLLVDPLVADMSTWLLKDTPKISNVVHGEVTSVTDSEVVVDNGSKLELKLPYDYLVLATGSAYADAISAGTTPSHSARKQEFVVANQALVAAQTVLIIGGGSTGLELAGEIATDFPAKKVTLVHSGDQLLPDFPPKTGRLILSLLQEQGVEVILSERAVRSGSGYALKNAGRQLEADIVYWCTGGTPNTGFLKDGNADVLNASGYVKVDDYLRVEGRTNWFALGDITSLPDRKMGHNAHHHGEHVAKSIKASEAGTTAVKKLKPWKKNDGKDLIIVTLGRKAAVMSIFGWSFGGPRWSPSGFLPATIKSGDNMVGITRWRMGMPKA